jgi:hypothetical protein
MSRDDVTANLPCADCGYDLRAHAADGKCPECGAPVSEAIRIAAIPRRPRWRDSDPRWRRRMLAGVWLLALLPLMQLMRTFRWAEHVPVPNVFDYRGTVNTLDHTFLFTRGVYEPIVFCIGMVLLFSKERDRRQQKLDQTRRWGIACTYIVALLSAAQVLVIVALVMVGIAALFLSMPPEHQPNVTRLFVELSTGYLLFGPQPMIAGGIVQVAASCVAVLLACVPLFDALRGSGGEAHW